MATVARMGRRLLPRTLSAILPRPGFLRSSEMGQRKIIPLGPKIAVYDGAILRGDLKKTSVPMCVIHASSSSPTGQLLRL
ncbi:hypothetical protein C2S52_021723 [Perilla frutescens var. hirtella]|uniref:Uncharacterized protein n=1 Tax=Perilla frutescens var. hirtella TaxID=608512 RepID=A0AAD4JCY2_PERFH|nr:hypothetical protein C2S52_021723 [Perilla frutescens var. hirtella]KAH6807851.1 hypothetical protein C2S51_028959 [Perilla frutescens var. frutescens]KAH6831539.1 hypothetical protein C2S53_015065 [Perilla frutescens var. hirtella]